MKEKITERRQAAALAFDPDHDNAPVVVAAGRGAVAENILKAAQDSGVPIVPDRQLASILNQISVGDAIPPDLYGVVAQILVFVSQTDEAFGAKMQHGLDGRPRGEAEKPMRP